MTDPAPGILSIVATPIGDPDDLSPRALDRLQRADLIAAEDTRIARTLLKHWGVEDARLVSYYDHNEQMRTPGLVARMVAGERIALVSDAGTPLINDPGYRVVAAAIEAGLEIETVAGPCAAIAALTVSGLPCDRFLFCGYAPRASSQRRALLDQLATVDASLIFYEGPHRIIDLLNDMAEVLGDRLAALARNLTKHDQRVARGPVSEIAAALAEEGRIRGEMTLVVDRPRLEASGETSPAVDRAIRLLLAEGLPARRVRDLVCEIFDGKRRDIYQRVLELDRE
ncbi:16S rRNA (cytidine(1402)-2'-O)-methyltransferase [Lignipirellula cremea]|uniref:Ribosomal RNA small subunit methyltransferase I n=1 Tax=Lignipirellula cremea TaxID=2528010 RepID=A0A518DV75_9BACT|nr:16S rRNA (cytidine(1402)-2'-O)-methyltransferase [Lignipirellula cremea]QDU95742.1 Ribosomal RNA small subunit methyltransferase I [Lignipirellula cremea]